MRGDSSGAPELIAWAQAAEEFGFDVVYVGDRLLSSAQTAEGQPVYDAAMLDPFVLLAAISAKTERIRLATFVTIVPFRHPTALAKLTASLDVVSGGRFVFGVGAGWSAPELRLFGVDPRRRGAQLEEGLRFIRQLWNGDAVSEAGEFWNLDGARVSPPPVQEPGPPVWVGSFRPDDEGLWAGGIPAGQQRVLARVGRIADGWVPAVYSPSFKRQLSADQLARAWEIIAEGAVKAGRDPASIEIIYPHWVAIVESERDRRAAEAGLAKYFEGSYADGQRTYLIGTSEEIAERVLAQTSKLDRVDGYLFTAITGGQDQLDAIATKLRPLLATTGAAPRAPGNT